MFGKTLVLVDTLKDIKVDYANFDLINIGNSKIICETNFKEIILKNYIDKYFNLYRKKFSIQLYEQITKKFRGAPIDFNFFEFCNFRNDKDSTFEKLILLSIIKNEINLNSYDKIVIYFDENKYFSLYSNFVKKKIVLKPQKVQTKKKINFNLINIFKFLIKVSVTSLICKFITPKSIIKKNKTLNISLYPILFFKTQSNTINLNFIHTDDTHFSENYFQTINRILKTKKKNMINIEYFFKFIDIFYQIKIYLYYRKRILDSFKKNIFFKKIKIDEVIFDYLDISYLNYFKLTCMQNAIVRANNVFKPDRINYFLFEYNFGFFLKKNFYDSNNRINFYGFQHGIFNENLMWFDFIKRNKDYKKYLPQNINYKFIQSKTSYFEILNGTNLINNVKKRKKIKFKISKKSKKVLIILGLHDYNETISKIINHVSISSSNTEFICKIHPKTKINREIYRNNPKIKIVKTSKLFTFKKIFISKFSTLSYDFILQKKSFFILHKNAIDFINPKFLKNKMNKI